MAGLKSYLGHRAREALVHVDRLRQAQGQRRIVVFPSGAISGDSDDLRGRAIGRALTRLGWRSIVVPPQMELSQRLRVLRWERPDLILIQQSRHPLNRPSLYPGFTCVYDADDADILDPRCTDIVAECCRQSAAVIAGSHFLAEKFQRFNDDVTVVWTGTYIGLAGDPPPNAERKPIVAWATSDAVGYPVEGELVRETILRLGALTKFEFQLYGVHDEAALSDYLAPIRDEGIPVQTFARMPYGEFVRSLETVAVGLQPVCLGNPFSRGKSFGKILAYLAARVAIVASNAIDHPLFFRHGDNGMLVDDDPKQWSEQTANLLANPIRRGSVADAGRRDFLERLTTDRSAALVSQALERVRQRAR
jgi:hypothetical protein